MIFYLRWQKVSVDVSEVSNLSLGVWNKVSENPTDSDKAERICNFVDLIFFVILQDFNWVSRWFLRRFIDGANNCSNALFKVETNTISKLIH